MPSAEELAFLARIREQPDDDGPRLVFADWLDEKGDPRGQLIRVQCAVARLPENDPRRAEWSIQEQALLDKFRAGWIAALNGLAPECEYRRGLIESISVISSAFVDRGSEIHAIGSIRRVRFLEARRCFAALVDSPHFGQIREIDLCHSSLGNSGVNLLARSKHLGHIEFLNLGSNDLSDQALRILAGMPQLGQLRELCLDENRQLGTPGLRALADSPFLGELRRLDLSGNGLTESGLKVLINGDSLKKLDSLVIVGNQIGDGGVERLANSDLLKRMLARSPTLDLRQNGIGPIGARALAEAPIVQPLEQLLLDGNAIGDAGLASLGQSPYLTNLKRLSVRDNRIGDAGVTALAHSPMPETLAFIDLHGCFITSESVRAVEEAARRMSWERVIDVRHDAGLHLRAPGPAR
jgi:uncharacterized protein (TIGR02996 family)